MKHSAVIALIAGVLLLGAGGADAAVRQVSLTSPVGASALASLKVNVSPRARCTIAIIYNTSAESRALTDPRLTPKTGGTITWQWRVPKDAHPARTPIVIRCGGSGELRAELLVGPIPELPRIFKARVVSGTKFGKAVRVSYCFRSLPTDPRIRPSRLIVALDDLRPDLPPLSIGWKVTKRCGTIIHPMGGIKPPYVLRYAVEPVSGTWSREAQIRL